MKRISKMLPSPAMVVACVALVVALGGASYAATVLPKNSVGSAQLRKKAVTHAKLGKNAVTGAEVKDGTLGAADFQLGQLPAGPQGPQGPKGDAGAQGAAGQPGAAATKLFGAINVEGTLRHGNGVIASKKVATGNFVVTFDRSLAGCVATANYYNEDSSSGWDSADYFALTRVSGHPDQLSLLIWNQDINQPFSVPFAIAAFC